ncbi:cytochrome c oxidase accessory protein CcoG [Halomonas sp. McH1-25]|uniref:cytochrome c oxidase accessory protein CcoG n=1 Tax=unclassified Halomonas TaxID=2609666 RepID=UPI001EF41211|nr:MULTISPECIES: cytochrome c oxidase accessory protein CcoG [unclassified Halomonas]MCG7600702.1 cytochrome c oxidase accessory protein CcoG [Halomonas sp. McH1-25]MCP1341280.1 cytochrome c oxidase accessory protein CcoG [Halomonas sp. FL8]MCP1361827.1 cytochrome c oxidase accessory protein CcoG [Halomonas sp. BBD45]MCP1364521.1 cytochrome c oxidase accessory protein CcoG [Halomonas sp. BBD48]
MTDKIPLRDVTPAPVVGTHDPQRSVSQDMYARRKHIYVREIKGLFQRLRRSANWVLMALYFGIPWLYWGDRQAVLFDLPSRAFHIFGATFYPQDFMLLSWLLIICAFGLFLITVFAGRVWCGYTCPQSVWTWLFIWVEHITEGSRNQRMKLDKQAMTGSKARRKGAKHALWLLIAFATGLTFVGYFTPIRGLVADFATLDVSGWALFWVGFFTVFTYLNAGWLREQVCIYMCPYARFQAVMFDKDTLVVSYDTARGEPRGARKKTVDPRAEGIGGCIDCGLCVQVCPTGIDIRNGLQYECITCAACIDACDSVMDKMNYPRGLIRYTTEHALEGRKTHILRPRLLGYLAALVIMLGLFAWTVADRLPLDVDIERDRNQLYSLTQDGDITNFYTLHIRNLDDEAHRYRIVPTGLDGIYLIGDDTVSIAAGSSTTLPLQLAVPSGALDAPSEAIGLRIEALEDSDITLSKEARFLGQARR